MLTNYKTLPSVLPTLNTNTNLYVNMQTNEISLFSWSHFKISLVIMMPTLTLYTKEISFFFFVGLSRSRIRYVNQISSWGPFLFVLLRFFFFVLFTFIFYIRYNSVPLFRTVYNHSNVQVAFVKQKQYKNQTLKYNLLQQVTEV